MRITLIISLICNVLLGNLGHWHYVNVTLQTPPIQVHPLITTTQPDGSGPPAGPALTHHRHCSGTARGCCRDDNNIISDRLPSYHYSSISQTLLKPNNWAALLQQYFTNHKSIRWSYRTAYHRCHLLLIIFWFIVTPKFKCCRPWRKKTIPKGSATLLTPGSTAKQQILTMMVTFTQVDSVLKIAWVVHSQRLVKFPSGWW